MQVQAPAELGVLDASEIPPTFSAPQDLFQPIIAGGDKALRHAVEGREDDISAGSDAASPVTGRDFVLGISASGKTLCLIFPVSIKA